MNTVAAPPSAMKTLRTLAALALVATTVALVSGLWLWLADPVDGSTLSDRLGGTAAFSGIAAGLLFGAAAIWAQVKNLWEFVPRWIRVAVLGFVVVAAIYGISGGGRS